MKTVSEYLATVFANLEKLDEGKKIAGKELENLLAFSKSVANQSIEEAARYHQESHLRIKLEPQAEITANA